MRVSGHRNVKKKNTCESQLGGGLAVSGSASLVILDRCATSGPEQSGAELKKAFSWWRAIKK